MFFWPFQSFPLLLLSVIPMTIIVPSYSTIIGMAMHVWVNMSVVGDTTPAKMKARRMKTRRLAFSMAAVTSVLRALNGERDGKKTLHFASKSVR